MTLIIFLTCAFFGFLFAMDEGPEALFLMLLVGAVFGIMVGAVGELIEGPDFVERVPVESLECIDTVDGVKILADERLFSDFQVASENVIVESTYERDFWTWPVPIVDSTRYTLEATGCPVR